MTVRSTRPILEASIWTARRVTGSRGVLKRDLSVNDYFALADANDRACLTLLCFLRFKYCGISPTSCLAFHVHPPSPSEMSAPLSLRPLPPATAPARHPPPDESAIRPWKFSYAESKDGAQANLLVLLHGLGDTSASFLQLGKQLSLPGTCALSLQAPFPYVPLPG